MEVIFQAEHYITLCRERWQEIEILNSWQRNRQEQGQRRRRLYMNIQPSKPDKPDSLERLFQLWGLTPKNESLARAYLTNGQADDSLLSGAERQIFPSSAGRSSGRSLSFSKK